MDPMTRPCSLLGVAAPLRCEAGDRPWAGDPSTDKPAAIGEDTAAASAIPYLPSKKSSAANLAGPPPGPALPEDWLARRLPGCSPPRGIPCGHVGAHASSPRGAERGGSAIPAVSPLPSKSAGRDDVLWRVWAAQGHGRHILDTVPRSQRACFAARNFLVKLLSRVTFDASHQGTSGDKGSLSLRGKGGREEAPRGAAAAARGTRGDGGSETRPRKLFQASLRAGSVQTHGAFAVFGQLVGLRDRLDGGRMMEPTMV